MVKFEGFFSSWMAGTWPFSNSKHSFRCARRFFSNLLWTSRVPVLLRRRKKILLLRTRSESSKTERMGREFEHRLHSAFTLNAIGNSMCRTSETMRGVSAILNSLTTAESHSDSTWTQHTDLLELFTNWHNVCTASMIFRREMSCNTITVTVPSGSCFHT